MSWFEKLLPSRIRTEGAAKRSNIPEGLWTKCPECKAVLYRSELERNAEVCPKCEHHIQQGARRRLHWFLDEGSRSEIGSAIEPLDVLKFKSGKKYKDMLAIDQKATGEKDALVAMEGKVKGVGVVAVAFEYRFRAGSMGSVVGERFVRAVDVAIERGIPFVSFACSGGARMQEGLFALFQMAKTSAAITRLHEHRLPYVSVLTHPTTGGVSASLGMLGDINIAEPGALICFTGPRVIEQTIGETLPEGFQRSEFLLKHGAVDMIVDRRKQRDTIANLVSMLNGLPKLDLRGSAGERVG